MLTAIALALCVQAPNDPIFPAQFGLQLIGVPAAWEITTGSASVPLVDIDSGVQLDHPDLTHLNPASDPWDNCDQHGTLMSGTITADANNGIGIAGILWQSDLTVFSAGYTRGSIAASIDRARTTTTAKVVLIEREILPIARQQPLKSALDALWNDGHRLAIVPAGNVWAGGQNLGGRNDPHILVVGACGLDGSQASYSNFGNPVDLWAPGHATSTAPPDTFGAGDGTSQAGAYVLGVAGLVLAVNPSLTGEEVQDILISTATPMGAGLVVNAEAAVLAAQP
jgi:subtilisin family serine protease